MMTGSLKRLVYAALVAGFVFSLRAQTTAPAPARGNAGGRGAFNPAATIADHMLAVGDTNNDQKLEKAEFTALADAWFDMLDLDGAGRLSQEEFVERFGGAVPPPSSFLPRGGGLPGGGRGGFWSSRFVGLFIAVDADKDAVLTRVELKQSLERWFDDWHAGSPAIDRSGLVTGLNSVLPRTNMGGATGTEAQTPIPGLPKPPPSPVLEPKDAIETIRLANGFRIELAASEPMIEDPITISFDEEGRLFVVEMRGFMLDIDRTREREPIGRISLLEDADQDGHFEKATVFVDGLILPRTVMTAYGGIFYVSDYKLWFAKDSDGDGKADYKELVDATYGSGNVEHGPNGMMRALDNWIYNAEAPYRYRLIGKTLIRQRTEFRGQWGITQDNYGRLFYNVNNSQLLGDFTPPNYMGRNPHHRSSAGLNLAVATDQRVFTIRMNTAVNRGYLTNVLDSAGKLYVFSSSCSPVIYRGDNYPAEFHGNAFVCDPSANLVKRNLVFERNLTFTSKFAYEDSEFLASTDERFRPVNLFNGPDGALWLVDMYRGISQYGMFMTSYLRRETLERGLDKGIHLGRIYRIVSTNKLPAKFPRLSSENSAVLVERLSDPNGWTRDIAQRLLIERSDTSIIRNLLRHAMVSTNVFGRIHALWTLEGLAVEPPKEIPEPSAVTADTTTNLFSLVNVDSNFVFEANALATNVANACLQLITDPEPKVQAAAIRVAETLTAKNIAQQKALLRKLMVLQQFPPPDLQPEVVFQAALTTGNLPKPESLPVLAAIASAHAEHSLIRNAILSGLRDWELQFLQILLADPRWQTPQPERGALLQALASAIITERDSRKSETLLTWAAGQKAAQLWRRKSLLDGMAVVAQNRSFQPIRLDAAPAAFETIAKLDDPVVRQQSERIKKLFAWPGHQSEARPSTGESTRPTTQQERSTIAAGKVLYEQVCAGCHGLSGEGLTTLAPPLANSDWVLGSENRLVRIALHGVAGPIHVNGTKYEPPQTLPDMPSLRDALDNGRIAAVLSYVRQSFGHAVSPIAPDRVAEIRRDTAQRELPWTETELLEIK